MMPKKAHATYSKSTLRKPLPKPKPKLRSKKKSTNRRVGGGY